MANQEQTSAHVHEEHAGAVEFVGIVVIKLISAKDLIKADFIGKSDPYCVFSLGSQTLKSKIMYRNLNPIWNETIILSWDGHSILHVNVMDHDNLKSDGTKTKLRSN